VKPAREFTGRFCIDDEVLREVGITDLDRYAVQPGAPLLPDLFLD
jgi:citronellol/citronellal dehydrogenase